MADALNCPFCGAEPLVAEHLPHNHFIVDLPDHPGSWSIECPACECGMIHATKEGLLAAWNKRAQSGAVDVSKLERFKQGFPDMDESSDGAWVLFSDVEDLIAAAPQAMGRERE